MLSCRHAISAFTTVWTSRSCGKPEIPAATGESVCQAGAGTAEAPAETGSRRHERVQRQEVPIKPRRQQDRAAASATDAAIATATGTAAAADAGKAAATAQKVVLSFQTRRLSPAGATQVTGYSTIRRRTNSRTKQLCSRPAWFAFGAALTSSASGPSDQRATR